MRKISFEGLPYEVKSSVADPDPGSGAFLPWIREKIRIPVIRDYHPR